MEWKLEHGPKIWELSNDLLTHYSFRPSLTPKQQRQVNKSAESKTEQRNGNGTAINDTAVKWNNNNQMEQQQSNGTTILNELRNNNYHPYVHDLH